MNMGHATLVADPYNGFSVVITDEWENVAYRTGMYADMQEALIDAARYLGYPITIELRMLKP